MVKKFFNGFFPLQSQILQKVLAGLILTIYDILIGNQMESLAREFANNMKGGRMVEKHNTSDSCTAGSVNSVPI